MVARRASALMVSGELSGFLRIESANEGIPLLGPRRRSMQHAQAREGARMARLWPQITPYPSPFICSVLVRAVQGNIEA
eukprot:153860-Pyramimonas_sp.AAC.1